MKKMLDPSGLVYKDKDDVDKIEVFPGCWRQTLVHGENLMLCLFTLHAGTAIALHSHDQEQAGYVVSGAIELTVDDGTVTIRSGCSYDLSGGRPHAALALEDSVVLDVFSPPREEYLAGSV